MTYAPHILVAEKFILSILQNNLPTITACNLIWEKVILWLRSEPVTLNETAADGAIIFAIIKKIPSFRLLTPRCARC